MPLERCSDAELEAGAAAVAAKFGKLGVISRSIAGTVLDAVVLMIERRAQIPLLSLIEDLTEVDPCCYDSRGYCQTHYRHPQPCPHGRAQRVLARARAHATSEEQPTASQRPTPTPHPEVLREIAEMLGAMHEHPATANWLRQVADREERRRG